MVLPILAVSPFLALALNQTKPTDRSLELYYKAIRNDDLAALKALIQKSGVEGRDKDQNTPLLYAAADGSVASVRMLLKAGANPNDANAAGATPLMWCGDDAAKVKVLLDARADVRAQSKGGHTPLEIVSYYDGPVDAMKLMIDKGADVNSRDKGLATPLETAAESNNLAGCRLLLAHGAKADTADIVGGTPLFNAASSGYKGAPLIKLLLANGARVNALLKDRTGAVMNGPVMVGRVSSLQMAVTTTPEAVSELLKAGADVNQKDIRDATPLVFAVACDHADPRIIKLLLDYGAKPEAAFEMARRYNNPAIMHLLGLKPKDVLAGEAPVDASSAPQEQVRSSIVKALKVCQTAASKFESKGGCFSCHAQVATGLAVWKAKPMQIEADYELEERQALREATLSDEMREDLLQVQDPPGAIDTAATYLLHLSAAQVPPNFTTDAMVHYVCAYQRKEGDWPISSGSRPPIEDGSFSATAKSIHAIRAFPIPALKKEMDERVARGANWLKRNTPVSTEDRTMQILGLVWAGEKAPSTVVHQLIKRQRPDGGWGQTDTLPTDAYATGEVLMALHDTGMKASDPIYVRGVKFLLKKQEAGGTWHVVSRSLPIQPYFQSGFPYDHDQWISQQGSAYAATALANVFDNESK
jgi:ankyrin repeat protein